MRAEETIAALTIRDGARAARTRLSALAGGSGAIQGAVLVGVLVVLGVAILLPLWTLLSKSLEARDGSFVGLANFTAYFGNPALSSAVVNSLTLAAVSTVICVTLAFVYAFGLTRTRMPARGALKLVAQLPILAPSLMPAIGLIYLFGNQGMLTPLMMGHSIYGPIGVIAGEVFWTFPHAMIILVSALSTSDARLYDAARGLGAGAGRRFMTVTLPGVRYGLIGASVAVFTLVLTDFGVPKVIGGSWPVLATDIYKQVVGQQNFQMGAVVGVLLLVPALAAFVLDRFAQGRQAALLSSRAVPCTPEPAKLVDYGFLAACLTIALAIVGVIGTAVYASLVRLWPYNMSLSLRNYQFDMMDGGGWDSFLNSLQMAGLTALIGTVVIFSAAYLVEKSSGQRPLRSCVHALALLPLAVPGLVLGLSYAFFFANNSNPLQPIYGTMVILVLCTVVHFYSVPHLTALTALKQMDPEFEEVSRSLRVPAVVTFSRVTVPVCLPAILDIGAYLFVNAMTTVSAVVFLYSPDTMLASVAVLNMDDAGDVAPAAAMATVILVTSAAVRLLYDLAARGILKRTQAWRER